MEKQYSSQQSAVSSQLKAALTPALSRKQARGESSSQSFDKLRTGSQQIRSPQSAILLRRGFGGQVRNGFTLIELLVVMAIISILASILFPVFASAKKSALQTKCSSNLKQILMAWMMYADDYDDKVCMSYYYSSDWSHEYAWDFTLDWTTFPPGTQLGFLGAYTKSGQINSCPSFYGNGWGRPYTGYGYNATYIGGDILAGVNPCCLGSIKKPADTVVFADAGFSNPINASNYLRAPSDSLYTAGKIHFRHNETANVAYADGHVKSVITKYLTGLPEPDCGALSDDDSAYDLK